VSLQVTYRLSALVVLKILTHTHTHTHTHTRHKI